MLKLKNITKIYRLDNSTDVKALDDMILLLKFNTGEQRVFDATILNGEVFKPLRDIKEEVN